MKYTDCNKEKMSKIEFDRRIEKISREIFLLEQKKTQLLLKMEQKNEKQDPRFSSSR